MHVPQYTSSPAPVPYSCHAIKSMLGKYPSLEDILNDKSAYPYNLTAFVGFLSQNHCLETIEFILDVQKYKQAHEKSFNSIDVLVMMWQRIINTYIQTDSPKELNLPSEVKAKLMALNSDPPPEPACFDEAVLHVKDIMKENAYRPFIVSVKAMGNKNNTNESSHPPTSHCVETCLQPLSNIMISPFGSNDSTVDSTKSDCSWHQPESWNSDCLSKSSSVESLFVGDEAQGLSRKCRTNPMTPPESPMCCLDYNTRFSVSSPANSESSQPAIPRHHSHWRKMSQRLKWRRTGEKELRSS